MQAKGFSIKTPVHLLKHVHFRYEKASILERQ